MSRSLFWVRLQNKSVIRVWKHPISTALPRAVCRTRWRVSGYCHANPWFFPDGVRQRVALPWLRRQETGPGGDIWVYSRLLEQPGRGRVDKHQLLEEPSGADLSYPRPQDWKVQDEHQTPMRVSPGSYDGRARSRDRYALFKETQRENTSVVQKER